MPDSARRAFPRARLSSARPPWRAVGELSGASEKLLIGVVKTATRLAKQFSEAASINLPRREEFCSSNVSLLLLGLDATKPASR